MPACHMGRRIHAHWASSCGRVYMGMHICMYIYLHVYMYEYMCIGFRVCLHATWGGGYMHTGRHLVGVHICVRIHVCICVYRVSIKKSIECLYVCIECREKKKVCLDVGRHLVGVGGVSQAAEAVGHRHQNVPLKKK
jgi:hypothetical protein